MSNGGGDSLMNAFVSIITFLIQAVYNIIVSICKFVIGLFTSMQRERQTASTAKTIQEVQSRIEEASAINSEMLSLTESALASIRPDNAHRNKLDEQCRYCKQLKTQLENAAKDVQIDLSKLNDEGFVFQKAKYSQIISTINGIRYSVEKGKLYELYENHSGLNKFVTEVLEFAGVKGTKNGANEWCYTKGNHHFSLRLDNKANLIRVTAKSVTPIKLLPSAKPVKRNINENTLLNFDDQDELVIRLSRKVDEFDHFDVFEYFTSVDKWLAKKEINEYAGKKLLTVREAFDLEDNVPELLDNCKKIAPPPVDYLPDSEKMHGGKQRWAQLRDVERAGMLENKGFIIGKMGYGSHLYTGAYNSHILTIASVGSGKGVGVVIPNLLRHNGSVVVLDPKGENYMITAKKRAELGNRIFYFDPWDVIADYAKINSGGVYNRGIKAIINPLDLIGANDVDIIDKANMIASSLIMRESDKDAYFYDGAEMLITRLIIFICTQYKSDDPRRNLMELRRWITADKEFLLAKLKNACIPKKEGETVNAHPVVKEFYYWLSDVLRTGSKGANDVYQFAMNSTSFLMSDQVKESFAKSNVDILSMKKNPMSLYLILDMNKLLFNTSYYRPMVRLIVTTCMMGAGTNEQPKEKLLFMLDEIAQLGTLQYLPNLLSIYRGRGVVVWTIWQNLAQIKEFYEKSWQAIVGNCDVQQYFGVNDGETAEYVSKEAGMTTIYEESYNTSHSHNTSQTDTEARGEQYSTGDSYSSGKSSGYSYQGFNYTNSGGTNSSQTTSSNYTDSYNFSKSIQIGFSETKGKNLTKKAVPLITPFEVTTGNAYSVQFVFYKGKCPYPILSGKIKYFEDKDFYGEYSENLTRI